LRTDDLDKVGKTSGHHTFFEMLGNFSFGDYFKEEAVSFAWEFLTGALKIKKERLWVSVYEEDNEAFEIWKEKIRAPREKIIKLGDKENFWPAEAKAKGPNGPCGPCSEIFFDLGEESGCRRASCDPSCNCGRFIEVWNLVFTQFNRKESGILEPLPHRNIDTGMGLERLAAVMQGKENNFQTDLFSPIIQEITDYQLPITNYQLIYAVADHIRAITFAIYDGIMPSNEARGYVVRKLIRKSVLHLRALGINSVFLYKLVPPVAEIMRSFYPGLKPRQENISGIILAEEKNFLGILNSSETLFRDKFKERPAPEAAGRIVFELYDTYGIPLELSREWLKKNQIEFSQGSFEKELAGQKSRSQSQSSMKGEVFRVKEQGLGLKRTKFSGYRKMIAKAKILQILLRGSRVNRIDAGQEAILILDETVFYAQAGGQAGDTGKITRGKNIFEVLDTQLSDGVILHLGRVKAGKFVQGGAVSAVVDQGRRLSIARNHTATHLLQAALRKVLGAHVQQQGSLVEPERLRFDFNHFQALNPEELARVEEIVNDAILDNLAVAAKEKTLAQAKKSGALAFFQEKYAARVRVVSIRGLSAELCGGTHLRATGQIGSFKITQEGSVASGIRRIEAVTGKFARQLITEEEAILEEAASLLGVPEGKVIGEIEKRLKEIKELERKLNARVLTVLSGSAQALLNQAEQIKQAKFISQVRENLEMGLLRQNVDMLKDKIKDAVIALGAENQGRALLVIGISGDLCAQGLDAANLIREVSGFIGGSGGGRPDFAQAGGNNPQGFPQAFARLKEIIRDKL
jgi:alanyl-tRNA synthetase